LLREDRPLVVEYRIVRADGAVRWVYEKGRGILGRQGETLWIDGAIFDVTDRKRAEEAARRTTSLLETLIDNLRSGILVVGEDGRVGFVNDVYCRDLDVGLEPEELAGRPAREVSRLGEHLFSDPAGFVERIDEIVAAREAVKAEELALRDGRVIERDYVPVAVGDGSTVHLWQHRDITDRKRIEQELAAQNEELRALDLVKDEFLALISHELRTPLTSIIGYLELLRDEGALGEEERHFVGVVERNAQRLLRLVGDLLFVAQIEAGKLRLEPGVVDLAELAAECVEAQRPRAAAAEVDVVLEVEGPARLHGDRARLGQLLDNLVSNAIKFTLAGGAVRVRVSSTAGAAVLEVADSGIGIPPEEEEKLFDRFFRASTATAREIQGTGLGLTITKAIAEGHGGQISFTSEEGLGTTFRVELPLPAAAERAA
jgi:PAS domain S-box-containing protein